MFKKTFTILQRTPYQEVLKHKRCDFRKTEFLATQATPWVRTFRKHDSLNAPPSFEGFSPFVSSSTSSQKKDFVGSTFVRPTCTNDSIKRFFPLPHITSLVSLHTCSFHERLIIKAIKPRTAEHTAGCSDSLHSECSWDCVELGQAFFFSFRDSEP